jgi:DTW domain-containing protein YfiP
MKIDKETYLRRKAEALSETKVFQRESFCYTCFRLEKNCLCHLIKPFATKTHFVLLMHPMEAKKEKMGTGRLSKAMLTNSQIIMGVDFSEDDEVNALINDSQNACMVLYPGERAINVSSDDVSSLKEISKKKRMVLFLIDGTWPCAKKMMKLSKNIQALPRVSFTATHQSLFVIKEQPADYCLSTLESIHFYLSELDRRGVENLEHKQDNMIDVFKSMVEFQIECAKNPELPSYRKSKSGYSDKTERAKSKKWGTRRIIHRD